MRQKNRQLVNSKSGFTLLEMILVASIISIITVMCVPIYASLQKTNSLNVTTNTLVQDLYQAQILSRSEMHNSSWGVAINNTSVTLYAGTSYASRNSSYDSVFYIPTTSTVSGLSEVDYSKFYGLPQTTGTFTIKSGVSTSTATINAEGMVDY